MLTCQQPLNLRSSTGIASSTRTAYRPYAWFKEISVWVAGGAIIGSAGAGLGAAPGAALGALAGIVRAFLDGFEVSRASTMDENQTRNSGTTVSSGTFLVAQQATLDVELGEYERCLVARFHPLLLRHIWKNYLDTGQDTMNKNQNEDFESMGVIICTGKRENKCLPVQEKYFYFTQHFTNGDMLDVADLHNHPWLLQLRGIRDFMAFTSLIGAREVEVDSNDWFHKTMKSIYKDALHWKLSGSRNENKAARFRFVEQDSDINWALDELSRVYFEKLPTFPSIYTVIEEKQEWPWSNPDPNYLLKPADPYLVGCHQ